MENENIQTLIARINALSKKLELYYQILLNKIEQHKTILQPNVQTQTASMTLQTKVEATCQAEPAQPEFQPEPSTPSNQTSTQQFGQIEAPQPTQKIEQSATQQAEQPTIQNIIEGQLSVFDALP